MKTFCCVLYEYGEICDAKMFWDILDMKYNMNWSEKDQFDEKLLKMVIVLKTS